MKTRPNSPQLTRADFLRGITAAAALAALPAGAARAQPATAPAGKIYDLRDFVKWITEEFEPSVRLPGPAGSYARSPGQTSVELYGISDMACILHTIGRLKLTDKERAEWADNFNSFQHADTGMLVEKAAPTHDPLHNTAFALAAMQLLDMRPKLPVTMGPQYSDPAAFLKTLNWKTAVYGESHKGAGIGAIYALTPELGTLDWFKAYFAATETYVDPKNGLMGQEKPATGDFDQVGGTFHYFFLYNHFNKRMPFPERRIDTLLGLQLPDGNWDKTNKTWLTLDGLYLMSRTLRYAPYRNADVIAAFRRTMDQLMTDMYSPEARKTAYSGRLGVHSVTCAISIAAEAQQFLGAQEVVTDWPLKLVLDRRPFI